MLAVSQDIGRPAEGHRLLRRAQLPRGSSPISTREMALMTALRLDTLPTTILYDAEGREVWRMTGMADWEGERAARLLTEAEGG